ncbi:MAG: hypothetical protein GX154_10940 [Clostridiales bacterium]|nr:hypothetical protein [Clostridiales bacterium]
MYIHIGNDVIISGKNLIAIINMTNPLSPDLMEIIEDAQLDKRLSVISTKEKKNPWWCAMTKLSYHLYRLIPCLRGQLVSAGRFN